MLSKDPLELGVELRSQAERMVAIARAVLYARIVSLLVVAMSLPAYLPGVVVHLDSRDAFTLPLAGANRWVVIGIAAIVSAAEVLLLGRLSRLSQLVRIPILVIEWTVIAATGVALSLGALPAALPLALALAAAYLLMRNNVRWSFRLQRRRLVGRRLTTLYPGYAAPSPDAPRHQPVEYSVATEPGAGDES